MCENFALAEATKDNNYTFKGYGKLTTEDATSRLPDIEDMA